MESVATYFLLEKIAKRLEELQALFPMLIESLTQLASLQQTLKAIKQQDASLKNNWPKLPIQKHAYLLTLNAKKQRQRLLACLDNITNLSPEFQFRSSLKHVKQTNVHKIKEQCGGSQFGECGTYNSWSTLSFLYEKKQNLKSHANDWVGGNSMTEMLIAVADKILQNLIRNIKLGRPFKIKTNSVIVLNSLGPKNFLLTLLFSGYLAVRSKIWDERSKACITEVVSQD